jgi:hypothetical protein
MLRAGFSQAARALPLALAAAGGLGGLLKMGADSAPAPEAASFPTGNQATNNSDELIKEEE